MSESAPYLGPGTRVAGFRIERLLGRGGMSVVYVAEDLRLHRKVALKVIRPDIARDERFRERFLAESELAASLDHPHVIPIFAAGEEAGLLFIAMRYVEGPDLQELVEDGALSPARAVAICGQIAEALDAAHARALVHRDVKPSNVLIDPKEGRGDHVYLADFGLTRRLGDPGQPSGSGLSLGTPAYTAPEQVEGLEADGRADQYSLGCLLFECLTGQPPFVRSSEAALLFAHLDADPPSVATAHPKLPSALDPVIARAMAKEPDVRYGTCREFVEEVRDAFGLASRRAGIRARVVAAGAATAIVAAALFAFFLLRGTGGSPEPTGFVLRIDPETGKVAKKIPVGRNPTALAAGESGVWVGSRGDGTVSRIDPETNTVELEVRAHGPPADIALAPAQLPFGSEAPFVTTGPAGASVAVLDGRTGAQIHLTALPPSGFGVGLARVASDGLEVWAATPGRSVGRLDPNTGALGRRSFIAPPTDERADAYFSGLAVDRQAVWVAGDPLDRKVWRVDRRGRGVWAVALRFPPKDVAVGAGGVWVSSQLGDTVSRIDPATRRVTATVRVGRGAAGLAVGSGSVWVANAVDGTVSRIDPHTFRVQTIDVDGSPQRVAVGHGAVWVSAHAAPELVRPNAQDDVRVGVLAACEGDFGNLYESSLAGAALPLLERGATLRGAKVTAGVDAATVGGRRVQLLFGCSDGTAERALSEIRTLVEVLRAHVVVGPTWVGESLVVRDYARRHPNVAFVNGNGGSQSVTLNRAAPNFFSFTTDAAQEIAGLGTYAYRTLGWRRVVAIADANSFSYPHTAGFVAEFCALGGTIVKTIWVPVPAQDLAPYIAEVPRRGVDGFVMTGLPRTTLAFVDGVPQLRGDLGKRVVGGFEVGFAELEVLGRRLDGVTFVDKPGLGDSRPTWRRYIASFGKAFPSLGELGAFPTAVSYYDAVSAVVKALEAVRGDLGAGQRRFQQALAAVELDAPDGRIRLDGRRQAIGSSFVIQWHLNRMGKLEWKPLRTVGDVEQTFNGYFKPGEPALGQRTIVCTHGNPPPWARSG